MDEVYDDQGRAGQQDGAVFPGVGQRVRAGSQQAQERVAEQEQEQADSSADSQRDPETESADAPRLLRLLLSQQTGQQGAAALAEDVAERHQDHKDRRADGNAGDQEGIAGLRNEIGVREIVDDRDDRAEHHRQREMEVSAGQAAPVQAVFMTVCIHRAGVTSLFLEPL